MSLPKEIILFEEVQGFDNKARKIFFVVSNMLLVAGVVSFFSRGLADLVTITLLSAFLIFAIITYFIQVASLVTQVYEEGIVLQFRPLIGTARKYNWSQIEKVYIREYDAMQEYGGWGIKVSPHGLAFTTSGNIGLQIILNDGQKILIGTHKEDLLAEVLMRMGKMDY